VKWSVDTWSGSLIWCSNKLQAWWPGFDSRHFEFFIVLPSCVLLIFLCINVFQFSIFCVTVTHSVICIQYYCLLTVHFYVYTATGHKPNCSLSKAESQGTEYIFQIGQFSALYKTAKKKLKINKNTAWYIVPVYEWKSAALALVSRWYL
jgi:hypothetical protein